MSLASDSGLPASSVKDTSTLIVLPASSATRVYVESVAPSMHTSVGPPQESHWYSKAGLPSPSASAIPEISAVSVSPTRAVPAMAGAPVAGVFSSCGGDAGETSTVSLSSDSGWPASSVKDTSTLMVLPASSATRV